MTMQQDLKALEERWGLALQSAAFGVWDLDPRAHRVQYSPEWMAMLGYGGLPAEVTSHTDFWRRHVHPEDLQPMLDALGAHLAGRSDSYAHEFRLRAADGSWRCVLSRGRVVEREGGGTPLRVVGTLTDLTEHHELQAVRLARDHAEAASRAKTEFVSRMSHELRTPLNAVLGFAQLLSRRLGDGDVEGQRRFVSHIEQAGWQLLAMINDVLDLQRVEGGQLALQIEPIALAPLWDSVAMALAPRAARQGVQLRATALPPGANVQADAARLQQVLAQVLGNAIKFNHDGGAVSFTAAAVGPHWRLTLTDTGPGIPAAQLPHLFEAFNRVGREGPGAEGVGIGLVLARSLVRQMGGELVVHSTPGAGTTVEIDLPRAEVSVAR